MAYRKTVRRAFQLYASFHIVHPLLSPICNCPTFPQVLWNNLLTLEWRKQGLGTFGEIRVYSGCIMDDTSRGFIFPVYCRPLKLFFAALTHTLATGGVFFENYFIFQRSGILVSFRIVNLLLAIFSNRYCGLYRVCLSLAECFVFLWTGPIPFCLKICNPAPSLPSLAVWDSLFVMSSPLWPWFVCMCTVRFRFVSHLLLVRAMPIGPGLSHDPDHVCWSVNYILR